MRTIVTILFFVTLNICAASAQQNDFKLDQISWHSRGTLRSNLSKSHALIFGGDLRLAGPKMSGIFIKALGSNSLSFSKAVSRTYIDEVVAVSDDERRIAVSSCGSTSFSYGSENCHTQKKTIAVYEIPSGKILKTFSIPYPTYGVEFIDSEHLLVNLRTPYRAGAPDERPTQKIWNIALGLPTATLSCPKQNSYSGISKISHGPTRGLYECHTGAYAVQLVRLEPHLLTTAVKVVGEASYVLAHDDAGRLVVVPRSGFSSAQDCHLSVIKVGQSGSLPLAELPCDLGKVGAIANINTQASFSDDSRRLIVQHDVAFDCVRLPNVRKYQPSTICRYSKVIRSYAIREKTLSLQAEKTFSLNIQTKNLQINGWSLYPASIGVKPLPISPDGSFVVTALGPDLVILDTAHLSEVAKVSFPLKSSPDLELQTVLFSQPRHLLMQMFGKNGTELFEKAF